MNGCAFLRGEAVALVAAVLLGAILAACTRSTPSRFPHRAHLVEMACGKPGLPECLKCNGCHTPRQRERIHKLPEVSLCEKCHKGNTQDLERVIRATPERPFGNIEFDHDRHLGMGPIQGQCVPCHAGVVESSKPNVPSMSQCFTCHEHSEQWDKGECTPCHGEADLAGIMPVTFLRHDTGFMRRHAVLAAENLARCNACHSEADCNDCHDVTQVLSIERRQPERIERHFVHRADFMVRHAIEAQMESSRCQRCHEPEDCDSCHIERGVSQNRMNARNPHPPGWVGTYTGSSDFHGRAARRDIALCASCHEQGPSTNCIRCHKVGAYGGNPHPHGWRSARSTGEDMCRYCHE